MSKTTTRADAAAPKRRRADAERSIASIIDAALEALASDPDVSMAELARRAGVVRATISMHFPTRESLLDAVMEHAVAQVAQATSEAEPTQGEPEEALERVLRATWQKLSDFHGLLAINTGRLSVSWHLATIRAIAHAASAEVRDGRIAESAVEAAMLSTAINALGSEQVEEAGR